MAAGEEEPPPNHVQGQDRCPGFRRRAGVPSGKVADKLRAGPGAGRARPSPGLAGAGYRSESQGRALWQGRVLREEAPREPASPASTSAGLA